MKQANIIVKWIEHGNGDLSDAYDIRFEVFVDEQQVPAEIEKDEWDAVAHHVVLFEDGKPVATGRLLLKGHEGWLGRVAVRRSHRGKGLGQEVVRLLTTKAFELGAEEAHMHAQLHAQSFYENLGYTPYGEPFEEAGINHICMMHRKPGL